MTNAPTLTTPTGTIKFSTTDARAQHLITRCKPLASSLSRSGCSGHDSLVAMVRALHCNGAIGSRDAIALEVAIGELLLPEIGD